MIEGREVLERMHRTLDRARERVREVELRVSVTHSNLTRFANSVIHQNMSEDTASFSVRVIRDSAVGAARVVGLDPMDWEETVSQAIEVAGLQKPNPHWSGLPGSGTRHSRIGYDAATASYDVDQKAAQVADLVSAADAEGEDVLMAGAYETTADLWALVNSEGTESLVESTSSFVNTNARKGTAFGFSSSHSWKMDSVDAPSLGQRAARKCLDSVDPKPIEPGSYSVILEPAAVSDLVMFLSMQGFSAQDYHQGGSFMVDKLGEAITGENISIYDDGHDPDGVPREIDYEGVPRKRVDIIDAGVARAVVYDSMWASRESKENTGHALPGPNAHGPWAGNLFLAGGDASVEEIMEEAGKAVLVTRFHYTNTVDPFKTIITGMTRDGTFWVEDGEISHPVRNLRFTQSILEALKNARLIGRDLRHERDYWGGATVPTLLLDDFHFSSVTEF